MTKRAVIVLADGFEEIEATISIDILRRAGIDVIVCGLGDRTVKGAHDLEIITDSTLEDFNESVDAIVLPGGMPGADNLAGSEKVNTLVKKLFQERKIVAAICASPAVVLAPTGILSGKKATCYPGMEIKFDMTTTFLEDSVVVDGNIITSRGPATAFEFAFKIVESLIDKECADTQRKKTLA